MTDYQHGTMSTRTQQKTFEGFIKFSKRFTIVTVVFFIFLAIVGG